MRFCASHKNIALQHELGYMRLKPGSDAVCRAPAKGEQRGSLDPPEGLNHGREEDDRR
jgi:hypothetical protein